MWADLFAWSCAALLLFLLWRAGRDAGIAIAMGWVLAAAGSAVLALFQYFDLENNFHPWVVFTDPGQAVANVHQTNMLATLLAIGLLAIHWLQQESLLTRGKAAALAGLVLIGLAATASRTGAVHLLLIACLIYLWRKSDAKSVLAVCFGAFLIYLAAALALPFLLEHAVGNATDRSLLNRIGAESTCSSRKVLWSNVWHLISLKPWTGWGFDGLLYAHYITPYEGVRFCDKLSNAHNLFLQIAIEYGLFSSALVAAFILLMLIRFKPWLAKQPLERLGWSVLLLIGFHNMLEFPLWFGVFQVASLLAIWLIWHERTKADVENAAVGTKALKPFRRGLAVALLLGALAFTAFDYVRVSQLYTPQEHRATRYQTDTFNKASQTVFFKSHVLIAQVVVTNIDEGNASVMLDAALAALHIAPDSRIIRQVIRAAQLAGREDLVELHTARYAAAWPALYQEWRAGAGATSQ
jgi:O-antigen polymerase